VKPMRKSHRLPMGVYATSDCFFFFTICANKNNPPFKGSISKAIIESIIWRHENRLWNLHCYCLMPDHLHIVLSPSNVNKSESVKGILDLIASFKSYTTKLWWDFGGEGPLWQRSSYDEVIDSMGNVDQLILYVLNNPVRKGLVDHWKDYQYSGIMHEL